jgi:acyl-coenzyme A synthetase/AMP-(fatty) acid ligase
LRRQSELTEDEVMAVVVPRDATTLERVAELPRTENGKMRKYQLRDRGVTPTCWDRAPRPR